MRKLLVRGVKITVVSFNLNSCLYATRSSHPEILLKVAVLKKFENDSVKHLSFFFNRIPGLRYEISLK